MPTRRLLLAALALAAGTTLALAAPATATVTPPPPVPQFVISFTAIAQPPVSTAGLAFHSTACAIGPATHPIVVTCHESGHIVFSTVGGSGSASVSSALAGINWTFTLLRATATGTTYAMSGRGTESVGTTPILRPVRVTGRITVFPTPDPTIKGTEAVYPLPIPA